MGQKVNPHAAREALRLAAMKLPMKTKIIAKRDEVKTEAGGEQE